jgi:peptidoglycan/xylan/chitin deacetylase (PgdA/CDA1 family)
MKTWTMDVEKDAKAALEFSKLLKNKGLRGEFYICGKLLENHPVTIKKIARHHEVGAHGYVHKSFGAMDDFEQLKAIESAKGAFEKAGLPFKSWRFPNFSFTNKSFQLLVKAGIKKDSSLRDTWMLHPTLAIWLKAIKYEHRITFPYRFPSKLKELPWSTVDLENEVNSLRGRIVLHCYNYPKIKKEVKEALEG